MSQLTIWAAPAHDLADIDEVDTCTQIERDYIVGQYQQSFGPDWVVWTTPEGCPSDYEACGTCGFDHSYDVDAALLINRAHG